MWKDLDRLVRRCSRFSGWKLTWRINDGVLQIWDPRDRSSSLLSLSLIPGTRALREVHGRMKNWRISRREYDVLVDAILQAREQERAIDEAAPGLRQQLDRQDAEGDELLERLYKFLN